MADQSDVEIALVNLAAAALYPNGTSAGSVPGPDCRIYRGWPVSAALDVDLAAGKVNITIFPADEAGRNTTRYLLQSPQGSATPTLTSTVTGNSVSFGGSADAGQLAGISIRGRSYVYRTNSGDTPALVAANLATLISSDWMATLSGATITIRGAPAILARVVAEVSTLQEIRRQRQKFRIICWCPTPDLRDATASAIDSTMAGYHFIELSDTTQARIEYVGTLIFDQSQDALLYRRDLLYDVEYATSVVALQPTMLFGDSILNADTLIA